MLASGPRQALEFTMHAAMRLGGSAGAFEGQIKAWAAWKAAR
jgi:hypothetical protein